MFSCIFVQKACVQCSMERRRRLVEKIQKLSAQEAVWQPSAADWLWTQDKAGRKVVNPGDDDEMRFWAKALKVSLVRLVSAVAAVGTSADAIREYLRTAPKQR